MHVVFFVYKNYDAFAYGSEADFKLLVLKSAVKIIEHKYLFMIYLKHLEGIQIEGGIHRRVYIEEGIQMCM